MSTLETFRLTAEERRRKKEEKKNPKAPNVQNMTVREAFRRAALDRAREQKSQSPKGQENNAESIWQKEDFARLKEKFKNVGLMWYGTQVDKSTGRLNRYDLIPIEEKKEQWIQALTTLKNRPSVQRIELLSTMASEMRLTKSNTAPSDDAKYPRAFRFSPLGYSGDRLFGISFTNPSRFFMTAISDMWGHSREQKHEFREFMTKDAGLKGRVGLPQLFPAISQWIDRTK